MSITEAEFLHPSNTHTLATLQQQAHFNSKQKGFWDGQDPGDVTVQLAKLALVHSEVSEAVEAARLGEIEGLGEELADVVIRVMDLAGGLGLSLEHRVVEKMARNLARPYMHGKLA